MLSKFVLAGAAATAFVAAPAIADEAGKQRFVHEGYTYVYQVKEQAGNKTISGTRYPGAEAFNLTVRNGKVSGVSGGQNVAFNVDDARGAATGAKAN
ncbi:MAG: hypothetical protein DI547_12395 [Sphingobium sp.]|jgi:hypothetical protein|nr:MAG: hypothetical protein DI547_12395 [Sphingobium sp.]